MNEPVGIDQFIGATPQAGSDGSPAGLDQFIAPEMNEEQYGGASGMAKTAALGLASGATLSGSNYLLTHSGLMKPETLKALQETNPGTYGTSELAGALGSMIVAPELSPASLIGKVGKVVQGATEAKGLYASGAAMEALGLGGSTSAAKVLSTATDLGSHALGSAVEGALYSGLGNTMNEYSIGDPSLNGEKLASIFGHNLGEGALYGGALGGAIRGASTVLPEAVGAVTRGIGDLKETLLGAGKEGSSGLAGKVLDAFTGNGKLSDAMGERMTNLDSDQQAGLISKITNHLNEVHNNMKTSMKDFNSRIRPASVDALIDTADKEKVITGQQTEVIDPINQALEVLRDPRNDGLYSKNAEAKLEQLHNQVVEGLKEGNDPADIFHRTRDIQQQIRDWGAGIAKNETTTDTKNLLNGLSGKIGDYLKDPDVFGVVGANLSEHNNMLRSIYDFTPAFEKKSKFTTDWMSNTGTAKNPRLEFDPKKVQRIMKSGDQVKIDALNSWFDTVKKFPEHMENTAAAIPNEGMDTNMLSKIEDSHTQVKEGQDKFKDNLKNAKGRKLGMGEYAAATLASVHPVLGGMLELYNLASHPLETINKLAAIESLVNKATNMIGKGARAVFDPSIKIAEKGRGVLAELGASNHAEDHQKTHDGIAQLNANPQMMMDKVGNATASLHNIAPHTAEALQMATINGAKFLASKLPSPSNISPFEEPYKPSKTELAQFERYREIVERPINALKQVRDLTIGPETVAALQAVHPALYASMKQAVLAEATKMAAKHEPISFQKKQAISMFVGEPIDSALGYVSMMANQQAYIPSQSPQGPTKPSKAGMGKITLANRTGIGQDDENA